MPCQATLLLTFQKCLSQFISCEQSKQFVSQFYSDLLNNLIGFIFHNRIFHFLFSFSRISGTIVCFQFFVSIAFFRKWKIFELKGFFVRLKNIIKFLKILCIHDLKWWIIRIANNVIKLQSCEKTNFFQANFFVTIQKIFIFQFLLFQFSRKIKPYKYPLMSWSCSKALIST